jgi:hypothetical protein
MFCIILLLNGDSGHLLTVRNNNGAGMVNGVGIKLFSHDNLRSFLVVLYYIIGEINQKTCANYSSSCEHQRKAICYYNKIFVLFYKCDLL